MEAEGAPVDNKTDKVDIKFRLVDGSDIGPHQYDSTSTVETLKNKILESWPKDKENGPKDIKGLKLIINGKILENNKKVSEFLIMPPGVAEKGVITMHAVVQNPVVDKSKDRKKDGNTPIKSSCSCSIM
ncbi:hypothetical protein DM860_017052 [Cuscuta australis]|uniref:Membrane-anchored ubiquitin-fold protein n=1 Tax=Cuscuta australis TaxID=267555 RepID=A0A328DS04_9ASTE|nr:hypothetical protein DM860_017052 [Cuscuta australis]